MDERVAEQAENGTAMFERRLLRQGTGKVFSEPDFRDSQWPWLPAPVNGAESATNVLWAWRWSVR